MGVLPPPPGVLTIISVLAPLVSERVWQHAQVLLVGVLLVPDRCTVVSILRVMGLDGERRFKNYHLVLSRARWSPLAASRLLLTLLVERFVPEDRWWLALMRPLRNGPRYLDSAVSEIRVGFHAANRALAGWKYTASGVRRSSAL